MIIFKNKNIEKAFKLWCRHLKENGKYCRYRIPTTVTANRRIQWLFMREIQKIDAIEEIMLYFYNISEEEFYSFYRSVLQPMGIRTAYFEYDAYYSDCCNDGNINPYLFFLNDNEEKTFYRNKSDNRPWYVNAMNGNRCRVGRYNNYRR